jgi:threonine/homoserine/homoserine lactone efflux protein
VSSLLLRGFALGFAVAASPGPIFFLCLRRTLVRGPVYGLVSGFGVATADGFYAALATFGVAALTTAFVSGRRPLALIGGAALVVLGVRILLERPKGVDAAPATTRKGLAGAYLSTLGLTITNPATIISFVALAATLGLGTGGGFAKPAIVVVAVLLGSASWWCIVAGGGYVLRTRVTPRIIRGISTFSGLAIVALGLAALYSAVAT